MHNISQVIFMSILPFLFKKINMIQIHNNYDSLENKPTLYDTKRCNLSVFVYVKSICDGNLYCSF